MKSTAPGMACISVLLVVVAGCSSPSTTPAQVTTASATAAATASTPASVTPSAPAGQAFQIAKVGIQMMIPSDFTVVDLAKAKDTSAAYRDVLAEKTGMKADALKALASERAGVAVGPERAVIGVRELKKLPTLADLKKQVKQMKLDGTVDAVETGLGERFVFTIQTGTSFYKAIYMKGPTTAVHISFSNPSKMVTEELFNQVVPTFQAL